MEDPRWLRIVTVGLVLAALAVGYFLLTGRFNANKQTRPSDQVNVVVSPAPAATIIPAVTPGDTTDSTDASPSPAATPSAAASDPRSNITILPRTGYHLIILSIISAGVMISGLGLRKFPH